MWNGEVRFNEQWLDQPLRWKRPRRIFVCAHGDLFAENVPDEWIDRVFAVMSLAPRHTFQVLTKRAGRMRGYLTAGRAHPVGLAALEQTLRSMHANPRSNVGAGCILQGDIAHLKVWPLPQVWLGVSVDDQARADERIPVLLDTPAYKRFISAEPLLGPIDLTRLPILDNRPGWESCRRDALGRAFSGCPFMGETQHGTLRIETPYAAGLDWVIAGGESGWDARPMHPDWPRTLRDQCQGAGVPFFFKQWGEWISRGQAPDRDAAAIFSRPQAEVTLTGDATYSEPCGDWIDEADLPDETLIKLGKKVAGRTLDGREWSEFPA